MKTSDLDRSKRLQSLGWNQESEYYWGNTIGQSDQSCWRVQKKDDDTAMEWISAPQAGEMIEWLLGEGFSISIQRSSVFVMGLMNDGSKDFICENYDNLCNALADSVIWVLEKQR